MRFLRFMLKALTALLVVTLLSLDGCASVKQMRADDEGSDQDLDSLQVEAKYFGGGK